ncbi:hypothetical protein ACFQJC_06860 [Haloferax namakaokahaiae]|uniref:Peptidase S54 rhomboid domain-containing protein n=1 Tax=Haloferax namakaokahaiae TaxID=1748331 RepID=A0ABD5ZD64_9EURY
MPTESRARTDARYIEKRILESAAGHDILLLLGVPLLLVSVFALPLSVREQFVFSYAEPDLFTAFVSHFVHLQPAHLLANVLGYALLVSVCYVLSVASDDREAFLVVFVSLLVVLPATLSLLNLAVFRPRVSFGFSGVVMGFFGYLPLALFRYLRSFTDLPVTDADAPAFFFFGIVLIAAAALPGVSVGTAIATGAFVVGSGYVWGVSRRTKRSLTTLARESLAQPGIVELGLVGGILFVGYPFVAFPADPVSDGQIFNLYSHLLGYCLSFIAAYVTGVVVGFDFAGARTRDGS